MKEGGTSANGFTILESLIVLAVTAATFVAIAGVINGKQNKVEFQSAINSVRQQIQQIINESSSGYFPNGGGFTCSSSGATPPVIDTSVSSSQGTNVGCVFLGKVVMFSQGLTDGNDFQYVVWPIVGNQNVGSVVAQQIGTASANVFPAAVDPLAVTKTIQYGLKPYAMYYNGVATKTAGVGFLAGDKNGLIVSSGANGLDSGSQTASLYAVQNTQVDGATPTTKAGMVTALRATSGSTNYVNTDSVQLCMASGTTNQSGLLTIGKANASGATGASRALTVTLDIFGNTTCA